MKQQEQVNEQLKRVKPNTVIHYHANIHKALRYVVNISLIFVWMRWGERLRPNFLSTGFTLLLESNGLRKIRIHDLRHSCASLLLANGVTMKQIQEWLGHSDFSTTANIYAHLDVNAKLTSAQAMVTGLKW